MTLFRRNREQKHYYKVIERQCFDFLYEDSPVELISSASVFDIESFEYFLLLTFQNVSDKPIASLSITLLLYAEANIPYQKINYRYDLKRKVKNNLICIEKGDVFGDNFYIPLPRSYYKRLGIIIKSVTFKDGKTAELNISSGHHTKKLSSLAKDKKAAYDSLNIYEGIEKDYPAVVLPAMTKTAWLCCCGAKNGIAAGFCVRCGRERDWQINSLSEDKFAEENRRQAEEQSNLYAHIKKAEFLEKKKVPYDEETETKRKLADLAIEKVLEQERKKEKRKLAAIPRIALYFILMYLLYFALRWALLD